MRKMRRPTKPMRDAIIVTVSCWIIFPLISQDWTNFKVENWRTLFVVVNFVAGIGVGIGYSIFAMGAYRIAIRWPLRRDFRFGIFSSLKKVPLECSAKSSSSSDHKALDDGAADAMELSKQTDIATSRIGERNQDLDIDESDCRTWEYEEQDRRHKSSLLLALHDLLLEPERINGSSPRRRLGFKYRDSLYLFEEITRHAVENYIGYSDHIAPLTGTLSHTTTSLLAAFDEIGVLVKEFIHPEYGKRILPQCSSVFHVQCIPPTPNSADIVFPAIIILKFSDWLPEMADIDDVIYTPLVSGPTLEVQANAALCDKTEAQKEEQGSKLKGLYAKPLSNVKTDAQPNLNRSVSSAGTTKKMAVAAAPADSSTAEQMIERSLLIPGEFADVSVEQNLRDNPAKISADNFADLQRGACQDSSNTNGGLESLEDRINAMTRKRRKKKEGDKIGPDKKASADAGTMTEEMRLAQLVNQLKILLMKSDFMSRLNVRENVKIDGEKWRFAVRYDLLISSGAPEAIQLKKEEEKLMRCEISGLRLTILPNQKYVLLIR
jgi:hypothetical protein